MTYLLIVAAILLIAVVLNKTKSKKHTKDDTVSINNDLITIRLNRTKYAGAVDSIKVRGKEYVNSHDHGRLFQTALQIDGYGECFNPTEAGSHTGSDSILEGLTTNGAVVNTTALAASWVTEPNGVSFCPRGKYPGTITPPNTRISKQVSIAKNIITWNVTIDCPSAKEKMNVEILTGYLTADFNKAFFLNSNNSTFSEITSWSSLNSPVDGYPDGSTLQANNYPEQRPIVFSTEDGAHAIGVLKSSATKKNEIVVNHLFKFKLDNGIEATSNSCSKFSVASFANIKTTTNKPTYQVKLVVGTLKEVQDTLKTLV